MIVGWQAKSKSIGFCLFRRLVICRRVARTSERCRILFSIQITYTVQCVYDNRTSVCKFVTIINNRRCACVRLQNYV